MTADRAERSRRRRQERRAAASEAGWGREGTDDEPPITEHKNELLRESIVKGQTLLQMLDDDLEAAWGAYLDLDFPDGDKGKVVRGRIRGLAQAIATIRSPFSRQNMAGNASGWAAVIKSTEDEALARVRVKRRAA